jgi:aprataxin
MLTKMGSIGRDLTKKHPESTFKMGFHSVPSMSQLHLHVISTDFCSPALKTKRHYLSFTTPFFIVFAYLTQDLTAFQDQLKRDGSILIDIPSSELLLKGKLVCHHCKAEYPNIPKLKSHLDLSCP